MNLFERLYTYREKVGKHERENYLTELLAGVLERSPALCQLLCTHAGVSVPSDTIFRVRTQVSYPAGRPDLVLDAEAAGLLLLVECKLEAGEGSGQLESYQRIAQASSATHKAILFLTKYYEPPRPVAGLAYLRWHQLFGFVQQLPSPVSEIVTLFSDYLTHHHLHHTMSFTAADLLALEQIAVTTAKMDEVLYSVEWLFRQQLGSTNQHTASRSARLAEGWYGYWRNLHGVLYTAGFRGQGPGGLPDCFVAAKSWDGAQEPTATNGFQQALRQAWGLDGQPLDNLVVSQSITNFLAVSTAPHGLQAMREWFITQFTLLNNILTQYPHMLHGHTEPDQTSTEQPLPSTETPVPDASLASPSAKL
ncbi:MAG: hypothetical protein EOO60_02820 [Hymenobacter sp.]|nr:MAG: hypothetical protein EOO60_02820 [Hymenobacter sp.]